MNRPADTDGLWQEFQAWQEGVSQLQLHLYR